MKSSKKKILRTLKAAGIGLTGGLAVIKAITQGLSYVGCLGRFDDAGSEATNKGWLALIERPYKAPFAFTLKKGERKFNIAEILNIGEDDKLNLDAIAAKLAANK